MIYVREWIKPDVTKLYSDMERKKIMLWLVSRKKFYSRVIDDQKR